MIPSCRAYMCIVVYLQFHGPDTVTCYGQIKYVLQGICANGGSRYRESSVLLKRVPTQIKYGRLPSSMVPVSVSSVSAVLLSVPLYSIPLPYSVTLSVPLLSVLLSPMP